MKRKVASLLCIVMMLSTSGVMLSGCQPKAVTRYETEVEIYHPITGELITEYPVHFTDIPPKTPIVYKVKVKETGSYLTDDDMKNEVGRTLENCMEYFLRDDYGAVEWDHKYWPTEPRWSRTYSLSVKFDCYSNTTKESLKRKYYVSSNYVDFNIIKGE